VWLPGMDSNHDLDSLEISLEVIDSKKSLKPSEASKASIWYKIDPTTFALERRLVPFFAAFFLWCEAHVFSREPELNRYGGAFLRRCFGHGRR
jgi:hypothetical protein